MEFVKYLVLSVAVLWMIWFAKHKLGFSFSLPKLSIGKDNTIPKDVWYILIAVIIAVIGRFWFHWSGDEGDGKTVILALGAYAALKYESKLITVFAYIVGAALILMVLGINPTDIKEILPSKSSAATADGTMVPQYPERANMEVFRQDFEVSQGNPVTVGMKAGFDCRENNLDTFLASGQVVRNGPPNQTVISSESSVPIVVKFYWYKARPGMDCDQTAAELAAQNKLN